MSHISSELRSNEEALAAGLLLAVSSIGSLVSVAKTVGNRFVGSGVQGNVRGGEHDREPGGTREEKEEKGCRVGINNDGCTKSV